MRMLGAKETARSGLLFYALPESGEVRLQPKNGDQPVAVFPNCIVLTPDIHRQLERQSRIYWFPAETPLEVGGIDWMMNFCADADEYKSALKYLGRKISRAKVPVFNRPEAVLQTACDSVTRLVEGIPGLVVPKCVRFKPRLPRDFLAIFERENLSYPVLVRPVGSQTGHGLIMVESPQDWEKIHSIDWAGRELYITQFVDMRDDDGLHTKVRIVFINRKPFFRHAFWSSDPIVRTLPRSAEGMDKEVGRLDALQERPAVKALVSALSERVRLNFWGIDLGIGEGDRFLFFEATAAMSITQAYNTQAEHDRLYPVLLEPIIKALDAAVKTPSSWNCWQ
jgi:glutathione synthase/RimK-type ligase-like ATP-grasp enzyme